MSWSPSSELIEEIVDRGADDWISFALLKDLVHDHGASDAHAGARIVIALLLQAGRIRVGWYDHGFEPWSSDIGTVLGEMERRLAGADETDPLGAESRLMIDVL